jgi:hypothetical protein
MVAIAIEACRSLRDDREAPSVAIIYTQHSTPVSFVIEIDGEAVGSVAVSDPVDIFGWQTIVTGLSDGPHNLRIIPSAGAIAIDAFEVEAEHN